MLAFQFFESRPGIETAFAAEKFIPAIAHCNMADLVAQDHCEDVDGFLVTRQGKPATDPWGHVQTAGFHDAGYERHAREHVACGLFSHVP